MNNVRFPLRVLTAVTAMALPSLVAAQTGGAQIQGMFLNVIGAFAPLWVTVAILIVVIAGFTLMLSQQEEAIEKAKKTIISVMIGGILITIILFFPGGPLLSGGPIGALSTIYNGFPGVSMLPFNPYAFGEEARGVAEWLIAMAAMIGILIIIISVLRAVVSFGSDEAAYQKVRAAVIHVIIGLIVIVAAYVLQNVFFVAHNPTDLINLLASKLLLVLGIILFIAVAMLIFAGFRMIISFGREEEFNASKGLALRVVVGIIVIILSYAVVLAVALLFQ